MRQAIIEVSCGLLREGLGPLFDHGLSVVGSLQTRTDLGLVALVVTGDALPVECDDGQGWLPIVRIELTTEAYGRQRINRVSRISPTGRTAAEYASRVAA